MCDREPSKTDLVSAMVRCPAMALVCFVGDELRRVADEGKKEESSERSCRLSHESRVKISKFHAVSFVHPLFPPAP